MIYVTEMNVFVKSTCTCVLKHHLPSSYHVLVSQFISSHKSSMGASSLVDERDQQTDNDNEVL